MTTPLLDLIRRRITLEGPMPVSEYMALALGHPRYGYYTSREPFGRAGDFITAPEVSQMFGELIGLWLVATRQAQGADGPFTLVELGPGRGTLMADALRAAQLDPSFAAAASLNFVETSARLRALQAKAIAPYDPAPAWHDSLEDALAETQGPLYLIANEFFDALPIRQFVHGASGWCERMVTLEEGGALAFALSPEPVPPDALPPALRAAPEGSLAERCPAGEALAARIGATLAERGGAALIVDYGHGLSAPGDTLQAVRSHAYHPPLERPGEADLTAHVDFARLAECAGQAGAAVHGPVEQGAFLERLGIGPRADALKRAAPDKAAGIDAALERLTAREAMGRLFKALALSGPRAPVPPGFEPA